MGLRWRAATTSRLMPAIVAVECAALLFSHPLFTRAGPKRSWFNLDEFFCLLSPNGDCTWELAKGAVGMSENQIGFTAVAIVSACGKFKRFYLIWKGATTVVD